MTLAASAADDVGVVLSDEDQALDVGIPLFELLEHGHCMAIG